MNNGWTSEIARLQSELEQARRERDEWKREYSLINAGQLMAEEQVKKVEAELADLRGRMEPIKEAYERYKDSFFENVSFDLVQELWQAIKAAGKEDTNEPK